MSCAGPKTMSPVLLSCMVLPLRRSRMPRSSGSGTNRAGTSHGPVGKNVGKFFARSQSVPIIGMSVRGTRLRVVRSLQIV